MSTSVDDAFNPYLEWLGIRDRELPPHHYRLLGLEPLEDDPHIISNAADGTLARVRSFRPGPRAAEWKRLLDELEAARRCLLDDARKHRYDAELRSDLARAEGLPPQVAAEPATNRWPPGVAPPGVAPPAADVSPPGATAPPTGFAPPAAAPSVATPDPMAPVAAPFTPAPAPAEPSRPITAPETTGAPPTDRAPPVAAPDPMAPVAAPLTPGPAAPDPMAPVATPLDVPIAQAPTAAPLAGPAPTAPAPTAPAPTAPDPMAPTPMAPDPMAPVASPIAPAAPTSPPLSAAPQSPGLQPHAPQSPGLQPPPPLAAATPVTAVPTGATAPPGGATGLPQGRAVTSNVEAFGGTPATAAPVPNVGSGGGTSYRARSRRPQQTPVVIGVVAAAALLLGAVVMALTDRGDKPITAARPTTPAYPAGGTTRPEPRPAPTPRPTPRPAPMPAPAPTPTPDPTPTPGPGPDPTPTPEPEPTPEPTPPDPAPAPPPTPPPTPTPPPQPEPTPDPQQGVALRGKLAAAMESLSDRDVAAAERHLDAAAGLATDDAQRAEIDRVRALGEGVDNFLSAVREGMQGVAGGEVIQLNNTSVAIVEATPEKLIIRVAGRNRTYPIERLPTGLAIYFADSWFDQNEPSTKVFKGAFLLVDPNGDREEARQLWQEAALAGAEIDHLLPLLETDYGSAAAPPVRGPIPSEAEQRSAEQQVRGRNRAALAGARSASARYSLSEKFLKDADAAQSPVERHALYVVALDLATASGQAPLALRVVDQMEQWFEIDAIVLKSEALTAIGRSADNRLARQALARAAIDLADAALAASRYEDAARLARMAGSTARRNGNDDLLEEAQAMEKKIRTAGG